MKLSRIFGLMLLFFFFEAVVAVVSTFVYPNVSVFLACVAMTALALGVWAVFAIVTRILARPRAPQTAQAPRPVAPVAPRPSFGDDSLSQELGTLITEANRRLAGSVPANARGEAPTVGTMPLYLVIGGEGAGKTSAILNSGLEPRLLAGEASREGAVIPTRLCNLWFAEGAVMADISGRVLAQEAENWERVLRVFSQPSRIPRWKQLLLGRRSEANLKGVVLVCDTSQFVKANDPQRMAAFARTLSDRLQVAGSILRRDFPIYVVFSKCDGVQYFPEFFAHLSEPEGRRLLGATLPFLKMLNDTADIYADREGKRLTEYFNRLYMSLAEKRLVVLAREDETKKKATAYEFPRELKKIRGDVVQFLIDVFRPNPLQAGPRLRGFYFSGQRWLMRNVAPVADGTMAGFTVMPKRADATVLFGSKPVQPAVVHPANVSGAIPKWVFLTDLFHNVILKDRAGDVAPRMNTREQQYRNFAFAGVGALLLFLCLVWANSWKHNRDLLNGVQAAVQAVHYRADGTTVDEALADLDSLRVPLATLLDYSQHGSPFSYHWGLYSGKEVENPLSELYFGRFRRLVLDPSLSSLTTLFLGLQSSAPLGDHVYSLLKTYRMVTSGECKPDAEFLGSTLLPIWTHAGSALSPDESVLAGRQFQFYISELLIRNPYEPAIAENAGAVKGAQTYLTELNGPDKILGALVQQIDHDRQADMLSTYAPNYVGVLNGSVSVEAAYTHDGWNAMMDDIQGHKLDSAGEECVVGKQSVTLAGINFTSENERKVKDLYIGNYIQHWKSFVADHHVEPFHNASDAAQKLSVLADNNRSPLLGLIYMTSRNTNPAQPASEGFGPQAAQKVEAVGNKIKAGFTTLLGTSAAGAQAAVSSLAPAAGLSANDVIHAFEPASAVADPAHGDKWINGANGPYVQALQELGSSLGALPPKNDPKDPASQQAFDRANKALAAANSAYNTLGAMIPNTSSGVDLDLKALLKEPITYAGRVIAAIPAPPPPPDLTIPIRRHVNQSAKDLCNSINELGTKYPFDPTAPPTQEATLQDIASVFAPQVGTLAQFAQSPDVQQAYQHQGQVWIPNPSFPGEFSKPFLASLNALSAFQSAVYPDATGTPHFDYTITLDGTGHFSYELNVDGHTLGYGEKKAHSVQRLVWPPTTNQPTSLNIKASQDFNLGESGPWSVFRLLQEADKQEGGMFVFSNIHLAKDNGSQNPLQDSHHRPVQAQIHIDSSAPNVFGKGYFAKLRCENFAGWALK